jgi:hypothetical protein
MKPGYMDTALHQALTLDAEFLFVNADRRGLPGGNAQPRVRGGRPQPQSHPALFQVARG